MERRVAFRRFLVSIGIACLSAASSPAGLLAQDEPLWRYSTADKIELFRLTPLGTLLVAGDSAIRVLNPEGGEVIWARSGLREFEADWLKNLGFTPYALLGGEIINLESGETMWRVGNLSIERFSYVALPQRGILLLTAKTAESPLSLFAVDFGSGDVWWRQDSLFLTTPELREKAEKVKLSREQPILLDTDSTLVFFPSEGGLIRLHSGDGRLLWRSEAVGGAKPPSVSEGFGRMLAADAYIFAPFDKKLMALDAASGRVLWRREKNFPGPVVQMELTSHGLLVRGAKREPGGGKAFLDLLDPATGTSLWPEPFRKLGDISPFVVVGDSAYLPAKEDLIAIDVGTGGIRQMGPIGFEGGEPPYRVEMAEQSFLLLSNQNIALIGQDGAVRYRHYYPAPGASLFAKIASTALIVAVNVASAAWAQSTANATGVMQTYPMIVENPVLSARYSASTDARNYRYIFTKKPDATGREGFSLVKLDKRTGEELGRVWVADRSPDFVLDDITGTLFMKVNDHEIAAFSF